MRVGSQSQLVSLKSADEYKPLLAANDIILDNAEKATYIRNEASALASKLNGTVAMDDELLEEVANLVEGPKVMVGSFDQRFLQLPKEVHSFSPSSSLHDSNRTSVS